jgi:hypothetical protein
MKQTIPADTLFNLSKDFRSRAGQYLKEMEEAQAAAERAVEEAVQAAKAAQENSDRLEIAKRDIAEAALRRVIWLASFGRCSHCSED